MNLLQANYLQLDSKPLVLSCFLNIQNNNFQKKMQLPSNIDNKVIELKMNHEFPKNEWSYYNNYFLGKFLILTENWTILD
jgi:hypothetical protein